MGLTVNRQMLEVTTLPPPPPPTETFVYPENHMIESSVVL